MGSILLSLLLVGIYSLKWDHSCGDLLLILIFYPISSFNCRDRGVVEELFDYLDKTVAISKINYNHALGLFRLNTTEMTALSQHKSVTHFANHLETLCFVVLDNGLISISYLIHVVSIGHNRSFWWLCWVVVHFLFPSDWLLSLSLSLIPLSLLRFDWHASLDLRIVNVREGRDWEWTRVTATT